jgi:small subunit ribosomal protein S21
MSKKTVRHTPRKNVGPLVLAGTRVAVGPGPRDFEKAMRIFNRKVADANILLDLRKHEFYEKPSVKRKRRRELAVKRWHRTLQEEKDFMKNLTELSA